MARGWESKDVESRQEQSEAERRARSSQGPDLTPEQRARQVQRESLELTRTRVEADLARATHPRHRAQLQAALAHLNAELAKLN